MASSPGGDADLYGGFGIDEGALGSNGLQVGAGAMGVPGAMNPIRGKGCAARNCSLCSTTRNAPRFFTEANQREWVEE